MLPLSARFRFIAALFLSSFTAACWLSDRLYFGFSMFISEMANFVILRKLCIVVTLISRF